MKKNIQDAIDRLQKRIDSGEITTARKADEAAAEIAGDHPEKDQEEILQALFEVAGKEFPGDWEDYQKANRWLVTLHEEPGDKGILHFRCTSKDADDAEDQARKRYPTAEIINVCLDPA
jgi:hypothetical protein